MKPKELNKRELAAYDKGFCDGCNAMAQELLEVMLKMKDGPAPELESLLHMKSEGRVQ